MARTVSRLSARRVETLAEIGMHNDGGGLYLQVTAAPDSRLRKSWIFRYTVGGRERQMGLGPLHDVSLAEARQSAQDARELRRAGKDPLVVRADERTRLSIEQSKSLSFDDCAAAYISSHRAGWKNIKHSEQWTSTIATYCSPVFGKYPVSAVDVGLVLKVLEPIWTTKPETASRVRGRVERILDWAKTRGYRTGDNPAQWRGHLDQVLPPRSRVQQVKHHAALPYPEVPAFVQALRSREGRAAKALEFAILTVARTGEVLGARWSEIDLAKSLWIIPASRMKAGREHRVPLSDTAVKVLKSIRTGQPDDHVFAGEGGGPLSSMALLMMLRRMDRSDITAHGFRSSFRDWAEEKTEFPSAVAELSLAHTVGNAVEQAYRRTDLFEKRRLLIAQWGRYCAQSPAKSKIAIFPARANARNRSV